MPRSSAADSRYDRRARRARTLLAERPHAEPLLRFYLSLLELQGPVRDSSVVAGWLAAVSPPAASGPPRLRLERLPLDELSPRFAAFCREMPEAAPGPIRQAAGVASTAGNRVSTDLLLALLTGADFETQAAALGCEPAPAAFLPRAFLAPIAETLSDRAGPPPSDNRASECPMCGWPASGGGPRRRTGGTGEPPARLRALRRGLDISAVGLSRVRRLRRCGAPVPRRRHHAARPGRGVRELPRLSEIGGSPRGRSRGAAGRRPGHTRARPVGRRAGAGKDRAERARAIGTAGVGSADGDTPRADYCYHRRPRGGARGVEKTGAARTTQENSMAGELHDRGSKTTGPGATRESDEGGAS